jgi:DNA-binding NarL/FixJ family response regulator
MPIEVCEIAKTMSGAEAHCVLLADAHPGLSDGMRGLLATMFESVIMVADETSLFEGARRLQSDLAVVDLALSRAGGVDLVRRLRDRFPAMKLIIISNHNQASVSHSALAAGADGFVVKRAIATDLLAAADAVLAGQRYVSPDVARPVGGEEPRA